MARVEVERSHEIDVLLDTLAGAIGDGGDAVDVHATMGAAAAAAVWGAETVALDVDAAAHALPDETMAAEPGVAGSARLRPPTTWRSLPRLTWQSASHNALDDDTVGADVVRDAGLFDDLDATAGSENADFRVLSLLGEGGMGQVHLAKQHSLRREVALKTVRPSVDGAAARDALWREAVVMGQLDHPHVVPVHLLGVDRSGQPALVMKRVEGWTWQDLLDQPAHPLLAQTDSDALSLHLEILMKVADALEFAHSRGVIHRDVKPDNVMVGRYGEVYLADWGIALPPVPADVPEAAQATISLSGTPSMMAPEMLTCRRDAIGPWTDVFLLGATLHLVLTGRSRHVGANLRAVLESVALTAPFDYGAAVSPALAAVANRATAARPADRYPSAAAFRQALRDVLRNRGLDEVTAAAEARLDELGATLQAGPGDDPDGYVRLVHRLATEARFGFLQVHAANPDDSAAARGLDAVLEKMVAFELGAGHEPEARALYAELGRVVPEFEAQLLVLEQRARAAEAETAALQHLRQAHDVSFGRRTRVYIALPTLLFSSGIALYLAGDDRSMTILSATWLALLIACTFSIATALSWRRIRSEWTRQLLICGLATAWLLTGNRALALRAGDETMLMVLRHDAMLLALGGLMLYRLTRLAYVSAVMMVGAAFAVQRWPEAGLLIFSVATTLHIGMLASSTLIQRPRDRA